MPSSHKGREDVPDGPRTSETCSDTLSKHAEFYFADIIFLVENQLFKVPRRNFATESEVFSDMFQLPATNIDGLPLDGSNDDHPLRLDGIKRSDFSQLLRVMFPLESQQQDPLTVEEWTSVLKLSTMWQFHKLRNTAIKAMESHSMELVDKIVIARKFDVSSWLVPSLNALVQREKPLDVSEGTRLGMEWALRVAELRESGASPQPPTCQNCSYRGSPRCNSCSSTAFNRCGSCNNYLSTVATSNIGARGGRTNVDYSGKIREVFSLTLGS